MNTFEARYPGTCAAAGDRIKVGDPIEDTEDGYAHPDCVELMEIADKANAQPPCTSCWLVHAGECM